LSYFSNKKENPLKPNPSPKSKKKACVVVCVFFLKKNH
jgi:hypothetical protein